MNTARYNYPWGLFNQLQHELHNPLTSNTERENHDWTPAVDISETEKCYKLLVDIPGVDPKDIDVSMEKSVLAIKGTRDKTEVDEAENYKRVERSHGSFARYFDLPESVDAEKIEAKATNGVLTITIPKQEVAVSRRIEVKH